jgi:hypothetical protein
MPGAWTQQPSYARVGLARYHPPMRIRRSFVGTGLLVLLGACGPGSADTTSGEPTETSSSTETTTNTSPESSDETTATTETGTEECDAGTLDWCDDGDFPEFNECDLFAQDCPVDEKCVPFAENGPTWDNAKCVPVLGAGAPGEPCTTDGVVEATDDCDATSFCFGFDQDNLGGSCHPFCTGNISMPECIDGWACAVPAEGPPFCLQECDPLGDTCGAGSECTWTGTMFGCVDEGGAAQTGEACTFVNDCDSGLLCVVGPALAGCADDGCCTPFCSLMAGDGPCQMINAEHVCEPFFSEPPVGSEDVGVCVLAP